MRKLLSVILTAAILISSVSVLMLTALAEDPGFAVTEYGASQTLDTATLPSANRLKGTPTFFAYNATTGALKETENGANKSSAFLYDGNLSQGWRSDRDGYRYYNGLKNVDNVIQSETNSKFILGMGKAYNITTFLVGGSKNQHPITSFEIYVGDDSATLFDASNKVAEHIRTEGSTDHQYVVTLEEAVSAKYFGVKILEVDADTFVVVDNAIYLNELGAYGNGSVTVTSQTTLTKTSILHGSLPVQIFNNSSQSVTNTVASDKATSLKAWTNGRTTDDVYNLRMWNAHGGMTIAYDLGNSFNITEAAMVSGSTDSKYTNVAEWQVYASDSLDNLFDGSNCYGYVANTSGSGRVVDSVTLSESVKCRYVGIRIVANKDTTVTTSYMAEIAVYGDDAFATESLANVNYILGDNVINKASKSGTVYTYAKQGLHNDQNLTDRTTSGCHGSTGSVNVLYDNSLTNTNRKFVNATTSDSYGFHNMAVVFATDTEYTVDSVLVSIANKEGTVSYIAYVGDSKDTLFTTENILAVCDNKKGLYTTYACVDAADRKTGKVFGILITGYTVTSAFNVDEIAFFEADGGVKASDNVVIDGKNMLDGKFPRQGSGTTVGTANKDKDGNGVTTANLTNSSFLDISNESSFGGKGLRFYNGHQGANMTYDLGKTADISKIIIAGGKKTSGDNTMALGIYGVYVSDESANLYDLSNRVAMVVNDDYSQAHSFDLSGLNISGQYVGILLYGIYDHFRDSAPDTADTAFYLTEFGVYGNYATDAYTIINEPAADVLAVQGTNALKNAVSAPETDNALLTDGVALTDDISKAVQIENADGSKLTYNLGKSMNISSLLVGSVYDSAKNIAPCHYRIYLANDESSLYTDAALEVEYFSAGYKANSGNYAASTQLFDLANAIQAQYIGFEFVTSTLDSTTLTLSELGAYATYNMAAELTGDITAPTKVYVDGVLSADSTNIPVDALVGNHSVVVYDDTSNNNVYIVKEGVFTYKSELNNALATVGTQVRTDDPLAIRFVNSIDKTAKGSVVKYGAVVAKTAALSSKDLVIDSADYKTVNGVSYEKGVTDNVFADDGTDVSYTVAIYNIGTKQHLTYYAVRPYLIIDVDGVEYTVYGRTYESRPYDVAKAALEDTNANYNDKVMTYLNNIVNNSSLTTVSQALYTSYGLTDESVAASVKNEAANNDRLIRVIQKAMRGEDITLGVLGGSITMGANVDAKDRYVHSYAGILREWLENTFDVKVNLVNAGIGATTSTFGVHRIEKDLLQYNPDLVVLEYAVNETENETTNKTYEDCVRRILASSDDTALMLLFTVRYNEIKSSFVNNITCYYEEQRTVGATTYYNNQGAQMIIGNKYNLPMISYMDCIVPLIDNETFEWMGTTNIGSNLTKDNIHPSYFGHQILASLLTDYIANVAENVTADTQTSVETMDDALYGATYTNAKFYNSVDLPEEWIVSMGSFKAYHNFCEEYYQSGAAYQTLTHGWKAGSTDAAEPMVLNIPGAKSITMLMLRTNKIADGIKATVTVTDEGGSKVSKNVSNYDGNSTYTDTTVIWTADAGQDITLELNPVFNGKEGDLVVLGIMVGFDEAQ